MANGGREQEMIPASLDDAQVEKIKGIIRAVVWGVCVISIGITLHLLKQVLNNELEDWLDALWPVSTS